MGGGSPTTEMASTAPPNGESDSPAPLTEGSNFHPVHRTVIEPPTGWQLVNVGELWRYRELLFFLIWRDVKIRYKQAVLGVAWAVLQPAPLMIVFAVLRSQWGVVRSQRRKGAKGWGEEPEIGKIQREM